MITSLERGYIWVSIDELHFQKGSYRLHGHAPGSKKAIGICMSACTDYFVITVIDSMGNSPLSLLMKRTLFNDHFRILLSPYKEEKCVFFIDNASLHNNDHIQYPCTQLNRIFCSMRLTLLISILLRYFTLTFYKRSFHEAPTLPSQHHFLIILN